LPDSFDPVRDEPLSLLPVLSDFEPVVPRVDFDEEVLSSEVVPLPADLSEDELL